MAGSKRRFNIQGHVVVGDGQVIKLMHRLGSGELTQLFLQAKEQGQAGVKLDDQQYTLHRHSDHTFTLETGSTGHIVF